MRSVIGEGQFTPFGLWIRQYCRDSRDGFSVTNLDYVFEDYRPKDGQKKVMLIEEKQNGGQLHKSQMLTFDVLDRHLSLVSERHGYLYWGFFVIQFPRGATMPGPGMKLNNQPITCEQLAAHLNFEDKFCDGLRLPWRDREAA